PLGGQRVVGGIHLDQGELAGVITQPFFRRVRLPRGPAPLHQRPGRPPRPAPPDPPPTPHPKSPPKHPALHPPRRNPAPAPPPTCRTDDAAPAEIGPPATMTGCHPRWSRWSLSGPG